MNMFHRVGIVCALVCYLLNVSGCAPAVSTHGQLEEFKSAGPIRSEGDFEPTGLKSHIGPYRVMCGDILEFQMPAVLRIISADLPEWLRPSYGHKDIEPYLIRVSDRGRITLPIIGEIPVGGLTLAEIEAKVLDAYYPRYVVNRPMVVCEIKQYQRENERVFTVIGLVNKSGAFPYPPNVQYNLMEALAFAGGLDMVADPQYLKIFRQKITGEVLCAILSIDQKALLDAYTVVIKPGDVVYVDHTFRTRMNKFLSDVLHITVGADTRYSTD